MNCGDDKINKKKVAIMAACSLLLVAMVIALTVSVGRHPNEEKKLEVVEHNKILSKMNAINSVCQGTDYHRECVESLKSEAGNVIDHRQLIRIAFKVARKHVSAAANTSITLKELEKDPRTHKALQACKDLMDEASEDLERSFHALAKVKGKKLRRFWDDLKTWLSASITYQETCLDGFEGTKGHAGEKMQNALKISMKLSVNAIDMVSKLTSVLGFLNNNLGFISSRTLQEENVPVVGHGDVTDVIYQNSGRRLLRDHVPVLGHGDFSINDPFWLGPGSRRLLSVIDPPSLNPDIVVAKDGSGHFTTINEALLYIPKKSQYTTVIYIKEGVYEEKVYLNRSMIRVFMVGDGASKTRITGNLNYVDGIPTMQTATFSVLGDYFMAKNIGFENTAGAVKHQAVALRVDSDMSIFYNCSMDGYQDTVYAHARRQYYRDCTISGTIDFVFGDGSALFQNCTFMVRKPLDNQQCIVTAQGRNYTHQPTAIVIQNSSIIADPLLYPVRQTIKSYLGRPWRQYSRTIIMETFIDDLIQPQGWMPWEGEFGINTCYYTEFNNHGPGSNKAARVTWQGVKTIHQEEALQFTPSKFFDGDSWIEPSGVPYNGGFFTATGTIY